MKLIVCLFAIVFLLAGWTVSRLPAQTIEQSFQTPPDSAKPCTWWHWVNGNVSKEGITKDLRRPQRAAGQQKKNTSKEYDFYRDVAVLAFPTPADSQYRIKNWQDKSHFNPEQFGPVTLSSNTQSN